LDGELLEVSGAVERTSLISLGARDCIELITSLVVSKTGSQRGLQCAYQCRRRHRAFEYRHVGAGIQQRSQAGHTLWRSASTDQSDNWYVRPGGLFEQDIDNTRRGLEHECFLREQHRSGASGDPVARFANTGTDVCGYTDIAQNLLRQRPVASKRRQNNDGF
jgi:hypothetical protein